MRKPLDFVIGTAMWGWNVGREAAFEMLDFFYQEGLREVDAATNYPINRDPRAFRLSEKILAEWIGAHEVSDLKIIQKIGAVNNLRTPEINLNKSFLMLLYEEYSNLFGDNLDCLMVHWDNREDRALIENTFEAFSFFNKKGLQVGLSGIKFPELYFEANSRYGLQFTLEIKHNPLQSDLPRYQVFRGEGHRFLAYGINAGGLKLPTEPGSELKSFEARGGQAGLLDQLLKKTGPLPEGMTMNQFGLVHAAQTADIHGVILGCSSVGQLTESLRFGREAHLHPPISFA